MHASFLHWRLLSPVKGDIVFGLSVCLFVCPSVCLSGTLYFSFCARNSSYSFHHTQTKLIPCESWLSGVCHRVGGSVFSYPPKFRQNRSLKTAQNHKFQFLERHKSKSFRPRDAIYIPHDSPASVVKQDLLSLSLRPIFSSVMTSESVSGDASQGKFWQKRPSQIPDFFFFLNERVREGTGDPVHSGL